MREVFQEQLNIKLKNLKFDNVEEGWNNFRKTICEAAYSVLEKKVGTVARNISERTLCLIEMIRGLEKNYLSDRYYENKKKCKESGDSIKI